MRVYTIFDRVAEDAAPVFCARNDGVAIRAFRGALKDARPDEFRLYCVGEFDTDKVILLPKEKPEEVIVPEEAK